MAHVGPSTPPAHAVLVERLAPARDARAATLLKVAFGVAVLAALAQVRLQIGPVPITGSTLGVLAIGAGYGARLGATTMLAYLAVGALGVGVFAGGAAGLAALSGPTAGYLLAYPFAAALVGALARRGWDRRVGPTVAAMVAANLVIYALGLAWLARFAPDLGTTLAWGLWPFLAGDAVKIALAAAVLPAAWRRLARGPRR